MKSFYSPRKKIILVLTSFCVGFVLFCCTGIFNDENKVDDRVLGEAILLEQNCLIKGDINSKGEKIYYLPECVHYDKIIVDTLVGETWFCTEDDAVYAGFSLSPSCQ